MTTFLRTDGEHAEDANFFNERALLALLLALLAEDEDEEEGGQKFSLPSSFSLLVVSKSDEMGRSRRVSSTFYL